MSDDTMRREYPDEEQRRAVCESQWERENDQENKMPKPIQVSEKLKSMQDHEIIRGLRKDPQAEKNFGKPVVAIITPEGQGRVAEVYIYDVIAWPFIEAQDIVSQIPSDVDTINLHINSPGGSVWEGIAIFNWLLSHQAAKNVFIEGLAASMASVIAMVGDEKPHMAKSAYMMIHDPWVSITGNAEELTREADLLEKLEDTMAEIYADKSGREKDEIRQWMHAETYMSGTEAVEFGFAGSIEEAEEEAAYTDKFNLKALFGSARPQPPAQRPAAQRAASARNDNNNKETKKMNEKLRRMLEAKGLAADATDEQAQAFMEDLLEKGSLTDEEKQNIEAEKEKATKEGAKAEKERQAKIRHYVRVSGLTEEFGEKLIKDDEPLDSARDKIFAEMERQNPPIGAGNLQVGESENQKFRQAATDGMLMRAGVRVDKPAPGAEDFRGYEIASMIRESLRRAGVDVSGLVSRRAVADFVFRTKHHGSLSTDDFTNIFRDASNKTLLRAYQEYPATWRPWVNVGSASDFKTIYGISLSNAPDLKKVDEHGEYEYASLSDAQESYAVYKYGRLISLSWEMIINDDLRAFTRYPQLMGAAARRKEADLVYSLITGNPAMNDGDNLFHANHSNLITDGGHVSAAQLDTARAMMRKQTGLQGETLDLRPAFLLVPVAQETDAEVLLRSRGSTEDSKNEGVINPWYNRLNPIAEPRLDDDSTDSWYLVADPSQVDTIEVAYLDGYEQPTIDEQETFTRDEITWKCRHVFGCGAMDWRGLFKNDGTAA